MGKARVVAMLVALIALAMLLLSGPGTRLGWWNWTSGLWLLRLAAYAGIAAAALSAVLVLLLAVPRWRSQPWVPIVSLCIALAALAPPMILLARAKGVPPIHDITTDTDSPPDFVALSALRNESPNGSAYGGAAIAAQQRQAYANIKPLILAMPPREAVQKAIDAARSLGWEVVASDAGAGRIEATDTTLWFGFKDDIVVRVRAEGAGSRVDVRSASRVGRSDIGANAGRVRKFLAKLK